ncbi:MAG TPA: site-2 protease family protein [Anaeromyxobacteraceae bacterium]|nr:site-2 protease family protein [Anaeromyxobacteraceae bacterium]
MEPALFRPPMPRTGGALALGAGAGAVVGIVAGVPPLLAALFGAVAAAIALSARHARGLRLVADERGVRVEGGAERLEAAWGTLRLGFGLAQREDGSVQRYAALADPRGRTFAFCEPAPGRLSQGVAGADGRLVPLVELREAALLLALVVQRVPAWNVFPESLQGPGFDSASLRSARADVERPSSAEAGRPTLPSAHPERSAAKSKGERSRALGLWAVLAKLGSKLVAGAGKVGAGALKAVKTANVGWAAASVATWSLLFSWKFALALMLQLFIHEYGHVHAMRRTGMKVRGLYFVPLLGALAVTEDAFTSRRQQAYVALNGPLWGSLAALAPAGLFLATGDPMWGTIAAFWALVNLFNLLPIAPLDGGRVLQAFAFSYSSGLGVELSVLGLAAAVALAAALGFSVVWLVALLGALELASESQARAGARALRLLPDPGRFARPHWLWLRAVVGMGAGTPADALFLRRLELQERAARAEPLRPAQILRWGLAYAGLAAALVLLIWLMRGVPGAEAAGRVLA